MKPYLTILLSAVVLSSAFPAHASAPAFATEKELHSDTGYVALSWESKEHRIIALQQSTTPQFGDAATLYQGKNRSFFLSGLRDGTYYFRLRGDSGGWSDPLRVQVEHHPLEKAWLLFALGMLVFVLTAGAIVRGATHES